MSGRPKPLDSKHVRPTGAFTDADDKQLRRFLNLDEADWVFEHKQFLTTEYGATQEFVGMDLLDEITKDNGKTIFPRTKLNIVTVLEESDPEFLKELESIYCLKT